MDVHFAFGIGDGFVLLSYGRVFASSSEHRERKLMVVLHTQLGTFSNTKGVVRFYSTGPGVAGLWRACQQLDRSASE